MNKQGFENSDFYLIKEFVRQRCISEYAKTALANMQPAKTYEMVKKRQAETIEAMNILASGQHVPFMGLSQIKYLTDKITKGQILEPSELIEYSDFLRSFQLLSKFFNKNQYQTPLLFRYTNDLADFKEIVVAITETISGNQVKSDASRELKKVRSRIVKLEGELEKVGNKLLNKALQQGWLQERMIVKKDERYTLPVKSSFQSKVKGTIIERSNRGSTVFIEPDVLRKSNESLIMAKSEEELIIYQILADLTGRIAEQSQSISYNMEKVIELDLIFARAKYSRQIDGRPMQLNNQESLIFDQVCHPLLDRPIPLDLQLGIDARGLIITGPNAGGKTVVLKTIALICLMTNFGLCFKHGGNSSIGFFKQIFLSVGDQQSLENALSTFSGHMRLMSDMLKQLRSETLILLDEIGSGTEPNEGAALAIAILERMYQLGGTIVATTHYGEIKTFAVAHQDFQTAAMDFDAETLAPKYRLLLNQVGESHAFWIAEQMQLDKQVLTQAQAYLNGQPYATKKLIRHKKHREQSETNIKTSFRKGDRVWVTEQQVSGVYFANDDSDFGLVFIAGKAQRILLKRLRLELSANDLYPEGYDLNQLFSSYQDRKWQRDIDRGSKKAHKLLHKQAEQRKKK